MTILKAAKVSMRFGELLALNDVSFELEGGEVFGIAGPNGAGKTTLFNVLMGMLRGSGEIIFDGTQINGLRPCEVCHAGIARTFQIPVVFPNMTLFENLRIGAHFGAQKGRNEEGNLNEVINFLGLEGRAEAMAGTLDLFEKKLAMLGAALATKPKLLLLDEPMAGLSPIEIESLKGLVRKINKELGVTVIVIEHLMKVLTETCQRLMILHYGEKICIGPPEEVMKDSKVIEVYLGG